MPGIVVSDTSCLILLDKLGKLDLLNSLFGEITITKTIKDGENQFQTERNVVERSNKKVRRINKVKF